MALMLQIYKMPESYFIGAMIIRDSEKSFDAAVQAICEMFRPPFDIDVDEMKTPHKRDMNRILSREDLERCGYIVKRH